MNIRLNLATRPYIELRSVLARLRVLAIVLAVLAVPMLLVLGLEEHKATVAEAHVLQLNNRIAALRTLEATMRTSATSGPDARILTQAAFLNTLYQRKSFSWTATMSDLEDNLPGGVQVDAIAPILAPNGHVTIQMRVTGQREHTVDLVRNLEHSRHFVGPRLVGEALADQSDHNNGRMQNASAPAMPPVNFDILATYRPLATPDPANAKAPVAPAAKTGTHTAGEAELTTPAEAAATSRSHKRAAKPSPATPHAQGGAR